MTLRAPLAVEVFGVVVTVIVVVIVLCMAYLTRAIVGLIPIGQGILAARRGKYHRLGPAVGCPYCLVDEIEIVSAKTEKIMTRETIGDMMIFGKHLLRGHGDERGDYRHGPYQAAKVCFIDIQIHFHSPFAPDAILESKGEAVPSLRWSMRFGHSFNSTPFISFSHHQDHTVIGGMPPEPDWLKFPISYSVTRHSAILKQL
jgi:hypothetical protein